MGSRAHRQGFDFSVFRCSSKRLRSAALIEVIVAWTSKRPVKSLMARFQTEAQMIVGHGIDVVELKSIEDRLDVEDGDWVEGAFSREEQEQADPPPNRVQYFAGRYAAKEAVAKALGTGFTEDVAWLDIEILRAHSGAPEVRLSEGAHVVARTLGISRWFISISHSGTYAIASAIAEAASPTGL
jgi:holo-[acyl-carrier protein] synthase